jgi:hypothetical protein
VKPLALNLSQMKKIASDGKTSTFLHPSGHKMVIAHNGVSALQRKQLESMPIQKMADGGTASNDNIPEPDPKNAQQMQNGATSGSTSASDAWSNLKSGLGFAKGGDTVDKSGDIHPLDAMTQAASQDAYDQSMASLPTTNPDNDPPAADQVPAAVDPAQPAQSDQVDQTSAAPAAPISDPQAPPASQETQPAPGDFQAAYNQAQSAISDKQKIDAALAKSTADIQAKDLLDRESLSKSYGDDYKTFSDHQQQFIKDYMGSHIDPKHYQESMSTGAKVATGIGLLLGGMSSATTGVNPAMEFMNKQIDRDIKAQESRIDQQKTLLGANHELYQDGVIAKNQTRINMNDIYDHKIQLAASKLGTPIAAQAAKAAHANLAMQNASLLQQSAMRATVMKRLKEGGQGLSAMDLAHAGMIPPQDALKEQASIDSQNKALASAAEIFKKYRDEQTPANVLNPQSYSRVNELNAQATNLVMESDASKRLTPESAKLEVKPFWVKTTDSAKTVQDKLAGMGNLIRQHAAPTPYMSQYAPGSLPKYNQAISQETANPLEGKTAVNPKTGERIINKGGRWVPLAK